MALGRIPCALCLSTHKFVCDCGHPHDHHLFGGPCRRHKCTCTQYSQTNQRLPGESVKDWMKRRLSRREFQAWWRRERKRVSTNSDQCNV